MKLLILLLLFQKTVDPAKLYREGKYYEYLNLFYSDPKYSRDPKYIALTSLAYLNLGNADSSWRYFKLLPAEREDLLTLEGLSFRLGELLWSAGYAKASADAFYVSFRVHHRAEDAIRRIASILDLPEGIITDSLLYGLFSPVEVALILPLSGDFVEVGEEFLNGFTMSYEGKFKTIDEEKISEMSSVSLNTLIVGPLKSRTAKYIEGIYRRPVFWFSPVSEYIPVDIQFFFSPYKTLRSETEFLVDYILDSMQITQIALLRDTSWIDNLYAQYVREALARRGRFLKYDIMLANPLEFDSVAAEIDSEKVDLAIVSGLNSNSYFIYSAFKTRFSQKIIAGSSGWLLRLFQIPRYMINLNVASVPISEDFIIRASEELDRFEREFFAKYNYHPSDAGLLGYNFGQLLSKAKDNSIAGVLLNLRSLGSYVGSAGIVMEFSSGFRMYEIAGGNIEIRREKYGGEEEN